jgi:2-octaprenylphenol hydroxylase
MKTHYDVVIIGGGIVGLTLACALGDSDLRVALLDKATDVPQWQPNEVHCRVSAITLTSQRILENLQVWQAIQACRVSPFQQMHVWDSMGKGEIHFNCFDIGEGALGYIIENIVIQQALYQRAQQFGNIQLIHPATLQQLQLEAEKNTLLLESGKKITTKLVVGSDGAHSWVRKQAGIELIQKDYQQTAIIANVTHTQSHQKTAWQCFLPTGPLAHLPLFTENTTSIVWSAEPELAKRLLSLSDQAFCQELTEQFAHRLGEVTQISARQHFALTMRHAQRYVTSGIALIGDAAHTIHPLAGQGVNLGLLDACCLAEVLLEAQAKQRNIASQQTLRRYERWRKGDTLAMITLMQAFKQVFSGNSAGWSRLRSAGLNLANQVSPLKKLFMRYAMGTRGDLPKLACINEQA